MKILSVNAGSSSLKFQMYEMPEETVLISGVFERIGIDNSFYTIKLNGEKIKKEAVLNNHTDAVKILTNELLENKIVNDLSEIKAIGHRMVHGGEKYASSVIITDEVINTVEELSDLAPLHNPANLVGVRAFKEIIPNSIPVGVFDTAFHQTMKEENFLYPVPYEWYKDYGVRKYGFHGTSHKYVSEKMISILGKEETKIITCHIGNGGSLAAVKNGKCIDTSMGFTPLAGVMMGTRSGSIDPSVISFLIEQHGYTIEEVDELLNKKSGVLGISGVSSDFRDVLAAAESGNERAKLALEIFYYKVRTQIAAYAGAMGGVDVIVFTAGIGENSSITRKEILKGLEFFGFELNEENNNIRGKIQEISTEDSRVKVYVVPTNEELMIARDTAKLVK